MKRKWPAAAIAGVVAVLSCASMTACRSLPLAGAAAPTPPPSPTAPWATLDGDADGDGIADEMDTAAAPAPIKAPPPPPRRPRPGGRGPASAGASQAMPAEVEPVESTPSTGPLGEVPPGSYRQASTMYRLPEKPIRPGRPGTLELAVAFHLDHQQLRRWLTWPEPPQAPPSSGGGSSVGEGTLHDVDTGRFRYLRAKAVCSELIRCIAASSEILELDVQRVMRWTWQLEASDKSKIGTASIGIRLEAAETSEGPFQQIDVLPKIEGLAISVDNPEIAWLDRLLAFLNKFKEVLLALAAVAALIAGWLRRRPEEKEPAQ